MNVRYFKLVHQFLGWSIGIFSIVLGIAFIIKGALLLGLVSLAMAIAVLPVFEIPILIRALVLLIAFIIL